MRAKMVYFSDQEGGVRPQTEEVYSVPAWGGICAEISARINDGSFGASYPEVCRDGSGPIGTDEAAFWQAMRSQIPSLETRPWYDAGDNVPPLPVAMDIIQFCWNSVGLPAPRAYHDYFQHYHLAYDAPAGRDKFCQTINVIFRRNGMASSFSADGSIERIPHPVLREALAPCNFATGDAELDTILEVARRKFLHCDAQVRREALEKLWDAFERLKTVGPGANKRLQAGQLLDRMAGTQSARFRELLETEAVALREIGNGFQIRHSETTQEKVNDSAHVDYLFHRLFAFIQLALRAIAQ